MSFYQTSGKRIANPKISHRILNLPSQSRWDHFPLTDIQVLLKEKFSVDHALPSVYHVLERCGFSWISARSKHPKADPVVQEDFKKNSKKKQPTYCLKELLPNKIATLIPTPRRHRRHYFGVFAPNSPLRKQVVANAQQRPENFVSLPIRVMAEAVCRVSLEGAALIARVYEANPLIRSKCGGKVKILNRIGWPLCKNPLVFPIVQCR